MIDLKKASPYYSTQSISSLKENEDEEVLKNFSLYFPHLHFNSSKRREEFFYGRKLSRKMIQARWGVDPDWIQQTPRGLPLWPSGLTGSITHSGGWIGAWIEKGNFSLGIDLEPWITPAQAKRLSKKIHPNSIPPQTISTLFEGDLQKQMTLFFCLFECIQKCLGNQGLPPVLPEHIRCNSIQSHPSQKNDWDASIKIELKNDLKNQSTLLKINGFWEETKDFCVAFGFI